MDKETISVNILEGIRKSAAMYHGSPSKLNELVPRNMHGDTDIEDAVFGTPSKLFALAYAGKKWSDRDLSQSLYSNGKNVEREMVLREMRPGAIKDIYGGRKGYLYHLPPEGFKEFRKENKWEQINQGRVTPLKTEVVKNVLEALKADPKFKIVAYDPDSKETKYEIKRTVARMRKMSPERAEGYMKWRLQGAPPEIKRLFAQEMARRSSQ